MKQVFAIVVVVYALTAAPILAIALLHKPVQPEGLTTADMVPAPGERP
jgi:hypothetical protein